MVETLVFTTPNDGGSCKFFNHPILISSGNHPIGQHRCQAPEKCSVPPKLLEVREPRQILLEDGDIPEIRTLSNTLGSSTSTVSGMKLGYAICGLTWKLLSHPNLPHRNGQAWKGGEEDAARLCQITNASGWVKISTLTISLVRIAS